MTHSKEERNKALVLEAFDTLFNRREYVVAERYWSPNYIQHSAHIAPGREGLFNLTKSLPPTLRYEPGLAKTLRSSGSVNGRLILGALPYVQSQPVLTTADLDCSFKAVVKLIQR
jgi:hypothetical protein